MFTSSECKNCSTYFLYFRYNLYDVASATESTVGLAYLGSPCIPGLAAAILENLGYQSFIDASHELGHGREYNPLFNSIHTVSIMSKAYCIIF